MKIKCTHHEKHDTCQRRMWLPDGEKLCSIAVCNYRSIYINIADVPDDTVMHCGNIENASDFHTKAEWFVLYGDNAFRDYAYENHGEEHHPWHTARVVQADIYLPTLLDNTAENFDMYDGWYENVIKIAENDPAINAGIKRLNEIFEKHPTYFEDQHVDFKPKGTACVYFDGIEDCTCNNDPDDPGECVYEGGVEPKRPDPKCRYYKGR